MENIEFEYSEDYKIAEYDWKILKRLVKYIKPYSFELMISTILLITGSLGELSLPYLTKLAIDKYILLKIFDNRFLYLILLYLSLLIIIFICTYYQDYLVQLIGQKLMKDLRNDIFTHIQNLPVRFFTKTPTGKIMTRVTNDVEAINELFTAGVVSIIGDVFMLTGILIAMFLLSFKLACIVILVTPLVFISSYLFRKYVRETYNRVRFWLSKMNAFLQESISGISIIQIFNAENNNFNKFDSINKEYRNANIDSIFYYALYYPIIELIGAISIAIILFFGGLNILKASMTFGVLVAFLQYSNRFFYPISDLTEKYNIILSAIVASERIFKLLDERTEDKYQGIELLIKKAPSLSFQNVSFSYENEPVLKNISFDVFPQQKLAIIGPTGSGKTTIINLILKFYDDYTGNIFIEGNELRTISAASIRKIIGTVFQEPFLFSKSLRENLYLRPEKITPQDIDILAKNIIGEKFMKRFENKLEYKIGERGLELSTGERQLIAFTRALSAKPLLLILDEATSSIDPETEFLIQTKLSSWLHNHTAIIIAHRLSTIKNADKIILLADGKIIEQGSHAELMQYESKYSLFCKYFLSYDKQSSQPKID
jgi:ATP-binding cassette subfamily B protein